MATKLGDIISDKSKWVKGMLAADGKGVFTSYTSPKAAKFCLVGALHILSSKPCEGAQTEGCRVIDDKELLNNAHKLAKIITKKYGFDKLTCFDTISTFNDLEEVTFKQVQEVIKEFDK